MKHLLIPNNNEVAVAQAVGLAHSGAGSFSLLWHTQVDTVVVSDVQEIPQKMRWRELYLTDPNTKSIVFITSGMQLSSNGFEIGGNFQLQPTDFLTSPHA